MGINHACRQQFWVSSSRLFVKVSLGRYEEEAEERMCGACCALTEQLLATADDVEDVADECDALLRRAAEADVTSAEPLQVMASLRSQQGRSEEALEALRQSIAAWRSRRGGRDVDPDARRGRSVGSDTH